MCWLSLYVSELESIDSAAVFMSHVHIDCVWEKCSGCPPPYLGMQNCSHFLGKPLCALNRIDLQRLLNFVLITLGV